MKTEANKKWYHVAFRVERQRIAIDKKTGFAYIKNGWFVSGQIDNEPTTPDKYALNWEYLAETENEDMAIALAFDLRENTMKENNLKYCPIYNNSGYAYEGSY